MALLAKKSADKKVIDAGIG